jgi:hypothetical protein
MIVISRIETYRVWHWFKSPRGRYGITALDLVVLGAVLVYGLVSVRSFDLNMATLHEDDGPIFYAHAFKDPALFDGDSPHGIPLSILVPIKVATSAMVWGPALLWRYFDIDPYQTSWLLALIQVAGFGAAAYLFSLTVIRRRTVAVLAVAFAYFAAPWSWTPSNYGEGGMRDSWPYAAALVMAPILLAFVCVIRGRDKTALLFLLIAGLIHPGLTLHACVVVGILWLWRVFDGERQRVMWRLVGLAAVSVVIMLPSLGVLAMTPIVPLPPTEVITGMRHNQHMWPWGFPHRWPLSLEVTLLWLLLAALAWRCRDAFSQPVRGLWLAAVGGATLLGLSQVFGALLGVPLLLTLIGLRAFMWPVLVSLPLVAYYCFAHIRSGDWTAAVLSSLCLLIPLYAQEYALCWPLVAALLMLDASQGHLSSHSINLAGWLRRTMYGAATLVLLLWSVVFLLVPPSPILPASPSLQALLPVVWHVRGPLPPLSDRIALVGMAFAIGFAARLLSRPRYSEVTASTIVYRTELWPSVLSLLVATYASGVLWWPWQNSDTETASTQRLALDAQTWVRHHTPPASLFVVPEDGWRTMSLRGKLAPFTREDYSYVPCEQARENRNRMLGLYGFTAEESRQYRGTEMNTMQRERFWQFGETDFLRFASEFGATHLVLPNEQQKWLALPIAYENEGYTIYELRSVPVADECDRRLQDSPSRLPPTCVRVWMEWAALPDRGNNVISTVWQGSGMVGLQEVTRSASPLTVVAARGGFLFGQAEIQDSATIRIWSPPADDEVGNPVLYVGYSLAGKDGILTPQSHPTSPGTGGLQVQPEQIVLLSLRARLSTKSEKAYLLIQDDQGQGWERTVVRISGTTWQDYGAARRIRAGATKVVIGVYWEPSGAREWLEVKDMRAATVSLEVAGRP